MTSALVVTVAPAQSEAASSGPARQTGKIVSENPDDNTPDILGNGDPDADPPVKNTNSVYSVARVGNQIVVGGKFTQVKDNSTGHALSGQTVTRNNLFAFDATTGAVSTTFNPAPNGQVDKVLAGRDGKSVFLGGTFKKVAGGDALRLAKLNASTGALDPSFKPPALDARALDIDRAGPRLWVAGTFTHVGSVTRRGIVTLDPATGKRSTYYNLALRGVHIASNPGPGTYVKRIAVNPAATEVVAIGNFTSVDGQTRVQAAKLSLGRKSAALSPWTTPQFRQTCSKSFATNMTDVQYSPNGSYFVVSTTGGYGGLEHTNSGISGCDVVTRFPAGTRTHGARPKWTSYTGGDTIWSVEVTDDVIYVGGHQRWQNNPEVTDSNVPGPGAVRRPGIAALDPVNGLPYSWNPTRAPGVGVQDMLATEDGLYVGSDTDRFHQETHGKIAFVPLDGGQTLPPAVSSPSLPAAVYTVASSSDAPLIRRSFNGSKVTRAPRNGPEGTDAPDWSTVVGAFMINGNLYTGFSDGTLTKRTFDDSAYGAPTEVNTGDQLTPQTGWHEDVQKLTSIFYYHGYLYYTLSGSRNLYQRAFEVEDDLVGQLRSSTRLSDPDVHGAFVAKGRFYFARQGGYLYSMRFTSTGPTGKATAVSGPRLDSQNWASRVAFVLQKASN